VPSALLLSYIFINNFFLLKWPIHSGASKLSNVGPSWYLDDTVPAPNFGPPKNGDFLNRPFSGSETPSIRFVYPQKVLGGTHFPGRHGHGSGAIGQKQSQKCIHKKENFGLFYFEVFITPYKCSQKSPIGLKI
jgi:hypothetical protein